MTCTGAVVVDDFLKVESQFLENIEHAVVRWLRLAGCDQLHFKLTHCVSDLLSWRLIPSLCVFVSLSIHTLVCMYVCMRVLAYVCLRVCVDDP